MSTSYSGIIDDNALNLNNYQELVTVVTSPVPSLSQYEDERTTSSSSFQPQQQQYKEDVNDKQQQTIHPQKTIDQYLPSISSTPPIMSYFSPFPMMMDNFSPHQTMNHFLPSPQTMDYYHHHPQTMDHFHPPTPNLPTDKWVKFFLGKPRKRKIYRFKPARGGMIGVNETPEDNLACVILRVEFQKGGLFYKKRHEVREMINKQIKLRENGADKVLRVRFTRPEEKRPNDNDYLDLLRLPMSFAEDTQIMNEIDEIFGGAGAESEVSTANNSNNTKLIPSFNACTNV